MQQALFRGSITLLTFFLGVGGAWLVAALTQAYLDYDSSASRRQLAELYQKVRPVHWIRLRNARIAYEGKPGKKASVWRSDDGSQLFVSLSEPHPASGAPIQWHYLVFLHENKAEVAFRGTLLTKNGDDAWESTENEATSKGAPVPSNDPTCEKKGCPDVVVSENSVLFPSVYWDDRKSMVRVVW